MTEAAGLTKHQPVKSRREKRPPLTHFLCLPLVNTTSIHQLESSLAVFKNAHLEPSSTAQSAFNNQADTTSRLALPSKAFRPLGTLHLTLGVMSLPGKERLSEALSFFYSLDLAGLMREAEELSACTQQENAHAQSLPLTVSLESLHALPRPKAATVLHAAPVDPTGRLLPFCIKLREKFIEAGFIQNEFDTKPTSEQTPTNPLTQDCTQASQSTSLPGKVSLASQEAQLPSESLGLVEHPRPSTVPEAPKRKPRPLLLHATLVNTIYVPGRQNIQNKHAHDKHKGKHAKNKHASKRITFDARSLVSQYRHYYADIKRTILHPPPDGSSAEIETDHHHTSTSNSDKSISNETAHRPNPSEDHTLSAAALPQRSGFPFIWAKEIPLDTVCICEMGAKKLHPGVNDGHGLNERLGEQYTVVAGRSLLPTRSSSPSSGIRAE
ncbi:hypothetical protein N7475_004773 [Penicillium sp. IBT 31633x]|nr:hypothetical protein N7475_004773 [Penicillium sp. IBT 31633x]